MSNNVDLMPNQFRLLMELALFGGMQIVRHGRGRAQYDALEAMSYLKCTELSTIETRYDITSSGRDILTEHESHAIGPRNTL